MLLTPAAKTNSAESPLEAAAGTAGSRAIEAFAVLGNETRLSILLALWEAYEPFAADNAVPFSEFRTRLGNPGSGQFNYHLDKLTDQFVRKTDEGYVLRRAGHRIPPPDGIRPYRPDRVSNNGGSP